MLSLLHSSATLAVFNISRRFGKSTVCAIFCVESAIRSKQHIKFATAFLTDLEQFICPIFDSIIDDCPEHLKPTWMPSKKEYRFPNGSVIKLIGLDKNPNGLRGRAIDILIVDEASFVSRLEYLYRSVISPATADRKFKLVFISTPPESPDHFWASHLIPKAKSEGSYVELTMADNIYYSKEEKERLYDEAGGLASANCQREYFCQIKVDTNRAIAPNFNKALHQQDYSPVSTVFWQFGGDAGGIKDKTVIHKFGWDHDLNKAVFYDELVLDKGTTTPKLISEFLSKWGPQDLIFDAPGLTRLDFDSANITTIFPKKDDFSSTLLFFNQFFYLDQIIIHPRCKLLLQTLEGGLLTPNRSDFERHPIYGHADAIMSAIYCLRGLDKRDTRKKVKVNYETAKQTKRLKQQAELEQWWEVEEQAVALKKEEMLASIDEY